MVYYSLSSPPLFPMDLFVSFLVTIIWYVIVWYVFVSDTSLCDTSLYDTSLYDKHVFQIYYLCEETFVFLISFLFF